MKEPKKGQASPDTAPNAYTRAELDALAKSTGIPVETLWAMPRRAVQQKAQESAAVAAQQSADAARAESERQRALTAEKDRVTKEKLDSERPLTERMPWIGQAAAGGSALLPMLLPFLTRRYGADQRLIRQWDKATGQAEQLQGAARSGTGSIADATAATERASAFADQYKKLADSKTKVGGLLKDAGTIGGTTLSATELPVLPALIDRMMYDPGTRARDEADKKLTAQEFLSRLQAAGPITAGLSATGLKVGTLTNRNPQSSMARTNALLPQSKPGWAEGPQTMGQNYAGAASAELPLIDARRDVAIARQAAERDVQLAQTMPPTPPTPRGLLQPDGPPQSAMPAQVPQSRPPVEPLQSPSPAPVAQPTLAQPVAPRQISPPATGASGELPPAGPWANQWSPAARQAIEDHIQGGRSIAPRTGLTGNDFVDMITARLPPGTRPPGASEAKDRLKALRTEVGQSPTLDDLRKVWMRDPEGRLFAVPAAMAIGATGYGLLAPSEAEASGYYPDRGPRRGLLSE